MTFGDLLYKIPYEGSKESKPMARFDFPQHGYDVKYEITGVSMEDGEIVFMLKNHERDRPVGHE